MRAADDEAGLQVERVEQPDRAGAVEARPLRHLAQVGRLTLQALQRDLQDARHGQIAQVHARRETVGGIAGDFGQQLVARTVQREIPRQRAQRRIQVQFADERSLGVAGRAANRIATQLREQLGVALDAVAIFEAPTVAELAEYLASLE